MVLGNLVLGSGAKSDCNLKPIINSDFENQSTLSQKICANGKYLQNNSNPKRPGVSENKAIRIPVKGFQIPNT